MKPTADDTAVGRRIETHARLQQVSAAGRGDRDAATALIDELFPRMRRIVRKLTRDDTDMEDLAQDAALEVLRSLRGYRGDGFFEGWVDRVVTRAIFGARRRRRASRLLAAVGASTNAVHRGLSVLQDEYLSRRNASRILDLLREEQQQVVVYHYVLEMSVPEIAAELQIPFETVRSRLRLARRRLRAAGVVAAQR